MTDDTTKRTVDAMFTNLSGERTANNEQQRYIRIDVLPVMQWTDRQLATAIEASGMHIQRSTGLDATPFLLYELLTEIQRLRLVLRGSRAGVNE